MACPHAYATYLTMSCCIEADTLGLHTSPHHDIQQRRPFYSKSLAALLNTLGAHVLVNVMLKTSMSTAPNRISCASSLSFNLVFRCQKSCITSWAIQLEAIELQYIMLWSQPVPTVWGNVNVCSTDLGVYIVQTCLWDTLVLPNSRK